MKDNITEELWYYDLVSKCNADPQKTHSIIFENAFFSEQDYYQQLLNVSSQLQLLPNNARVMAFLNGNIIDLVDLQVSLQKSQSKELPEHSKERFRQIDFSGLTIEEREGIRRK